MRCSSESGASPWKRSEDLLMKRLFKRGLAVLLALVTAFGCFGMTAFAYTQAGETPWKVEIDTDSKTAVVIGVYDKSYASMEIPATFYHRTENNEITNYDIISVEAGACAKDTVIKSLTVGKNVAKINSGAFSGCTKLSSVTFEGSAAISSGAFDKCTALKKVNFVEPLTVSNTAFVGCHKDLTFVYEIEDYYNSEEALIADLKLLGGGKWTRGAKDDFYTWENKYAGYKVITSETSIVKDTTSPDVSITVEKNTWNSKTTASVKDPVCFDVETLNAEIRFRDNGKFASGLKYLGYYLADEPVTKTAELNKLPYTEIKLNELTQKDGWYIYNKKVNIGKSGVLYAIAEDVEGADGFANTPYLRVDQTDPTVSVINVTGNLNRDYTQILLGKNNKEIIDGIVYGMANYADKKDVDIVFNETVKLKFDAKDSDSGIASIHYMVRYGNSGPNTAGYSGYNNMKNASAGWTELASGDTIEITGNSKTWCLVYVKVTDELGHVAFGSSQYFKPGDDVKPVITATYPVDGEETSVSLSDGDSINVSGVVKLTASDDSKIKSFTYKESKDAKETALSVNSGGTIKNDGVYTIVAVDDAKTANTATVTVTITNSGSAVPVAAVTGIDNNGAEKKAEYNTNKASSNVFKSSYPVKVVITDDGKLNSVSYVYVDSKNVSKTVDVSETDAKAGISLSGFGKYTFTVKDNAYNTIAFTVTLTEPAHKITAAEIDTGNTANKTQVSCLGGTFKATITGTDIHNKIALFSGDTMIGKPVAVGSSEKPLKSVEIAVDTFKIPANNTEKEVEYVLRAYAPDAEDKDITSAKGTQLGKLTAAAKSTDIDIKPDKLTYTAAGSSQDITINSNCQLVVKSSDTWLSMPAVKGPTTNTDGTMTTVITVKAEANSGFNRTATITFTSLTDSTKSVIVNVEQAGVGAADRLAGNNRIETAVAISKKGWTSADNVVLANGLKFADALAGVPLAAAADAPILLTENKSSGLEQSVLDEIKRLSAKKVYVLGGTASVGEDIVTTLKNAGYTVERISGDDRYSTSVAIAEMLRSLTGKEFTKLYFANANNYPDALSISAAAAIEGNPILYVPTTGEAEKQVSNYVKNSKCKTGVILGGTAAVSEAGEKSLTNLGVTVTRISGSNRYETSVKINEACKSLFTGKSIAVATGESFPDALAGGALCAKLKMPVVLVSPKNYGDAVNFIKNSEAESLYIFGGTAVISDSLAITLAEAVK